MGSAKPDILGAASTRSSTFASFILSFGISLLLLGCLGQTVSFWSSSTPALITGGKLALALCLLCGLLALVINRWTLRGIKFDVSGFSAGLLVLFFSDWLTRNYNFFQGPLIRGEIIVAGLASFAILSKSSPRAPLLFTIAALAGLALCLFSESQGAPLFSDDHPTFFFRLSLLKENFPNIPFYYPLWNGGLDQRDFFATGSLNVFFLFWPIIYLFNLASTYNLIVALVLFGLVPLAIYLAARTEKLTVPASAIAALLAATTGLTWYRWALNYGTLGFIVTAGLVPLNIALLTKLVAADEFLPGHQMILLVISLTLMLFWSPSAIIFLPIGLIGLVFFRRMLKKQFALQGLAALIIINVPWMLIFWASSNVSEFIKNKHEPAQAVSSANDAISLKPDTGDTRLSSGASGQIDFDKSIKIMRETANSTNPLLFMLALPGLALLKRSSRITLSATLIWLFLLGAIFSPLKPQLEFSRMLIVMFLCCAVPVARAIHCLLFEVARTNLFRTTLAWIVGGFVLASPFSAAAIIQNRTPGPEHYHFLDEGVLGMADAIIKFGGMGRTLFSGCILHELDHGHLAPLTLMTGHPLMASSHVHNLWRYRQIFPKSYISRGDAGIEDYMDTYNVTSVVAHEKQWRDYFKQHSGQYSQVYHDGRFLMFSRHKDAGGYFLTGRGSILEQSSNHVTLHVDSTDAVVKFNYFPFLKSSGCKIEPFEAAEEVTLIKLTACQPGSTVTISAGSAWSRVVAGKRESANQSVKG
jgi:hypothetical protein